VEIYKIFKRYIKGNLLKLLLVILSLVFLNYLRSLIPLFVGKVFAILNENSESTLPNVINNIFVGKNLVTQLLLVAVCIVGTALIRDITNLSADIGIAEVSEGVGYNLQTDFYNHVQELPYSYLNHAQTGDLIQRSISDITRVKRFIGQILPACFNALLQIVIYSYQMLLINSRLGIYLLIPIPLIFLGAVIYFRKNAYIFTNIEESEGALTTDVQENLTGIRVVKAFANEKYEINKFNKAMDKFISSWHALMNKMSSYYSIMDGISYLLMLTGFVLSVYFVKSGALKFDEATSMFLYVESIIWPTRILGRQIGEMNRSKIAGSRILEIVDEPTEFANDGKLKPKIKGNIKFEDVFFTFKDGSTPTIRNINLDINHGETIALIGKTGSGKSTLVSMLNRMLDCTSGKILLDGIDIKEINKKYLRKNVGIVLQEPFLFSKTIAENIGIVLNKIDANDLETSSRIKSVARVAAVSNDIERFEEGYNTIVGERGVTLSGGQKQRIAIARTLVEYKPILIFDDSLSAVDSETDIKIRSALKTKEEDRTTIIITHRISTAMEADRIIVMEDGEITEVGTHDDLIKKPGLYQEIWNIQNHFVSSDSNESEGK